MKTIYPDGEFVATDGQRIAIREIYLSITRADLLSYLTEPESIHVKAQGPFLLPWKVGRIVTAGWTTCLVVNTPIKEIIRANDIYALYFTNSRREIDGELSWEGLDGTDRLILAAFLEEEEGQKEKA